MRNGMNKNYMLSVGIALSLVALFLFIFCRLFMQKEKKIVSTPPEMSVTAIQGKTDTVSVKRIIVGEKRMHRVAKYIPVFEPDQVVAQSAKPQPKKLAIDTPSVFETEIADSGVSVRIRLRSAHDSLPPMLMYSGYVEQRELRRVDTVREVMKYSEEQGSPWYSTFYAGAAAVILVLAAFLVLIK